MNNSLTASSPVSCLKGVGAVKQKALARMKILTVGDLLYHFPRAYQHRGQIRTLLEGTDEVESAFLLTVRTQPRSTSTRERTRLCTFRASDETGSVEIVFFNQPYVSALFSVGTKYRFWGKLHYRNGRYQMTSPEFEPILPDHPLADYVPKYSLTDNITGKCLQNLISDALFLVADGLNDPLPESIRIKESLPTLSTALREIHFPTNEESLSRALRRMMYEELFCMAIGIARSKNDRNDTRVMPYAKRQFDAFLSALPYRLTDAQLRCANDIVGDMCGHGNSSPCPPMRRILVGDVGSGKTVCAEIAAFIAAINGHQTALMVPTGILARQHYAEFSPLFEKFGFHTVLLTGDTPQKEKKDIYERLRGNGSPIDVIIGTHALLNEKVSFDRLGLTITDEQHRFGILQRASLKDKAEESHLLVMSATPIPRTLALSMYGDLSVSVLDEMPPGRQRVDTFVIDSTYRDRLNGFIRRQVEEGGQTYIVCPSIERREDCEEDEESSSVEISDFFSKIKESAPPLKDAVSYADHLQNHVFPDLRVALLHGQMKNAEKEEIMRSFSMGEIHILVSTTVIEVGVNVPRATLMIVENAERFGLSQLHQLRGRVGRGTQKAWCILVSDAKGETARQRLQIMQKCYDGYRIAEKDLEMRGPGDFFASADSENVRQSGGLSLRLAGCCSDIDMIATAFRDAGDLLAQDPTLSLAEHQTLSDRISQVFTLHESTIS